MPYSTKGMGPCHICGEDVSVSSWRGLHTILYGLRRAHHKCVVNHPNFVRTTRLIFHETEPTKTTLAK
jgi:hypothetical protein